MNQQPVIESANQGIDGKNQGEDPQISAGLPMQEGEMDAAGQAQMMQM